MVQLKAKFKSTPSQKINEKIFAASEVGREDGSFFNRQM